jgi:predicted kinase
VSVLGSMPVVLVVTGPVGAGKSTVSRLVAAELEPSVHIDADVFARFIAHGFIEQWRPEAAHQNEVLGGALAMAAIQFVEGGYSVLLDGHFFPDGFDGLAQACTTRGLAARYAVLRASRATCRARAEARSPTPEARLLDDLHRRFEDLGRYEPNVVNAERSADQVAADILRGMRSGTFVPRASA